MNLFARVAEKAFRAVGATDLQRQYASAKKGRLVGDHNVFNQSANIEIRDSIRQLRALGRALARDNDYFIGYLKKLDANVVGRDGIGMEADAKNADGTKKEVLNRKIEEAWKDWSRKTNCDVTGQQSMRDIASLAIKTLATDGEFLMRLVADPSSAYTLKLQMLDIDWLDEDYNVEKAQSATGNRIVMSVEVDDYDKPVAYHFTDPRWQKYSVPGIQIVPGSVKRLRIPAQQIIHRFDKVRAGQLRGIPWAHGALLTMNQLDGFDEAELVGARIGASNMAFVSPPAPPEGGSADAKAGIDTEVAPGQVLELPAGYTVHETNFPRPQDSSFSERLLRKVATSLGISYSTLTSDLSQVNFSSIRAGTIEEREVWKMLQGFLAKHLYQDIYEKWLMFNTNLVPQTQLDQVMYPCWRGRGFDWVDPLKDVTANTAAVDRGFKTLTDVLADQGKDFEETMDRHAYEKQYIASKGLVFNSPDMTAMLAQDAADAAAQGNTDNKKTPTTKDKAKGAGN